MTDPQQLHPDVRRLLRLVPPPAVPAHVADGEMWRSAEALAGVEYPIEMKQLHRAYGSGWFDDFVWVLNPAPNHDAYTLFDFGLNEFAPQDVGRVVPGVKAKEILPIAWTRAGEEFYYVARGPYPWPVCVVGARGAGVELHELTLPALLVGLMTGEIESAVLYGAFRFATHSFRTSTTPPPP